MFADDWSSIDWDATRHWVAEVDNYSPIHPVMKTLHNLLSVWERYGGFVRRTLRNRGLDFAYKYVAVLTWWIVLL